MSEIIAFKGEAQLLRWSETSNQGATITLMLSSADDLERFKLMTLAKGKQSGQRLMTVMVEIGDDELPVEQPAPVTQKAKAGMLCVMACKFCEDPLFHDWVSTRVGICQDASSARKFILKYCSVDSRKDLDIDKFAAMRFHTLIRLPFLEWKERR